MRNELLFNEIYSAYYYTITKLIRKASMDNLDELSSFQIIYENDELTGDLIDCKILYEWSVYLDSECKTAFQYPETRPLTNLELRWLKSIIDNPRIKLFNIELDEFEDKLEKVKPLFSDDVFSQVGQYRDGDDFENTDYIKHFQTILKSLKKGNWLEIKYISVKNNNEIICIVKPLKLEYSEREDKFRLIAADENGKAMVNLNSIIECSVVENDAIEIKDFNKSSDTLVVEIKDENNALERFLTDVSHYYKKVRRVKDNLFRVEIEYEKQEETELIALHLLPFLHFIEIKSPDGIIKAVRDRLQKQMELLKS